MSERDDARRRRANSGEADLGDIFYQPHTNQLRHEPMPASHDDDRWQEAVRRNQELAHNAYDPDSPTRRGAAVRWLAPSDAEPAVAEPGAQVAAGESEDGSVSRVRLVTRASPGHPDGEVNPGR